MAKSIEDLRNSKTLAVIDGNSLMHRAFHAVPANMNAPDGRATNACFGFMSMLTKMIDEFAPDYIICAFDAGKPKFRTEALEQYKAQRPPMDPLLKEQFPIMEDLLQAMGIPVVKVQGWEGDDILGTLAQRAEQDGLDALLVTGDKDAYQLATEHVFIVTTKKGLSDVCIYDPDAVFERYGVTPGQVPDFLGLKGDPSDNIPGVSGIGEKTAAKLLQEYGSLEGLFEHSDVFKGKMGENIRNGRDDAFTSRLVATISREVPIEMDREQARFPSFNPADVEKAFGELRFSAHLHKVLSYASDAAAQASTGVQTLFGSVQDGAKAVCDPLLEGDEAARRIEEFLDGERGQTAAVLASSFGGATLFDEGFELYVGLGDCVCAVGRQDSEDVLARLLRKVRIVCSDAKALLHRVFPLDSAIEAKITRDELYRADVFDVSVAAYLLESERRDYSIEALVTMCFGQVVPSADNAKVRDASLCAALLPLADELTTRLEQDGSTGCLENFESPLIPVLCELERTGVYIDSKILGDIGKTTAEQLSWLEEDIYRQAGEKFNIDSPKQLGVILFEKLGLPVVRKTKSGYSTDAKVLEKLRDKHPLPGLVESYRELAKIKSTYLDVLPTLALGDGRVHTHFNQTATATGRLSSSEPNLQNIPVRTEFGRRIRSAFVPREEDWVYLCADYSQIELRLLAHLSGDAHLVKAFKSGADFHSATASRIFGVDISQVSPAMRTRAKAVNFGIVYGQQAFGLGQTLHIPLKEAQRMIDRYFDAYPQVREYLDGLVEFARDKGYAQTMFGRKRRIPEIRSGNAQQRAFGERTAMNHPMQGSAADIIKTAMIKVGENLAKSGLCARMCIQVHDELDFEVALSDSDALGRLVAEAMEGAASLLVPLKVDVQCARAWSDAH